MDMLVTAHTVALERGRRIVLCELGDYLAEHFVAGYDLIVAFTHCRWIDAAVMDMLVTAHTVALERGRRIVLCELGDYLAEHFAVTATDQILPVAATLYAARVRPTDPSEPAGGGPPADAPTRLTPPGLRLMMM
jgi:anti-anti-sigma regulatory factor